MSISYCFKLINKIPYNFGKILKNKYKKHIFKKYAKNNNK